MKYELRIDADQSNTSLLRQQRGHRIIVSSGIQNSSFRFTAMRKKPLVNSVLQHGGWECSCAEVATSPRSIWPEHRISLASAAANRTSRSPNEQWRTLGGSGYGVARQLAGFRSERILMSRVESSLLRARRLRVRKLCQTGSDNFLTPNFLAYLPSCEGDWCS